MHTLQKRKRIKTLEDKRKRRWRKKNMKKRKIKQKYHHHHHHDVATGWCRMFVVDVVSESVLIPIVCLVGDTTGDECLFIRLAMDGNGDICWWWCCGCCGICEVVPFVNISTISYRISVIGVNVVVGVKELSFSDVNKLHGWSRWRYLAVL